MEIKKIDEAFSDERGSISDIFYKTQIDHVAIIKNKEGNFVRGNHYHKKTTQHIYMTKGRINYWYKPLDSNSEPKSIEVKEGYLVTSPPYEVHSLEIVGESEFIVFSEGLRGGDDYESDTFREVKILEDKMFKN